MPRFTLLAVLTLVTVAAAGRAAPADAPPRKVIVGTAIQGYYGPYPGLEKRLEQLGALVDEIAAESQKRYPGRAPDLIVLPENAVTAGRGSEASARAVPLEGSVRETFAALARRHRTYLVATLDLREGGDRPTYANAAVLFDRTGKVVGTYRKVHPVAELGQDRLEGGITPGRESPVFQCDFGKLGIQICYDMVYDDGWAALERGGAELVVWPSASPATAQPAARARKHGYYIVSSTYRNNAAFFEPTGMITAQARQPERLLVREIDLSYTLLPWSAKLRNGGAFKDRYGDRAGFRYYEAEDLGIFWSNDPAFPIARMIRELELAPIAADVERNRRIQDAARARQLQH